MASASTLAPDSAPERAYSAQPPRESSENRFRELVQQWKEQTKFTSSATDLVMNPAYQQIIGMGPSALPFLMAELRREPDHWFAALQAITGQDPLLPEERGDLDRMTSVWLAWGKAHGY